MYTHGDSTLVSPGAVARGVFPGEVAAKLPWLLGSARGVEALGTDEALSAARGLGRTGGDDTLTLRLCLALDGLCLDAIMARSRSRGDGSGDGALLYTELTRAVS